MTIAKELQGRYIELSKAKYGKFLVGKILEYGFLSLYCRSVDYRNTKVRDLVVGEFLGNVGRLISHKEAGMVVNDIYRDICTPAQKAEVLQELYGPEFHLFKVILKKIKNYGPC
jgi:pumilio family protein 6